MCNECTIVRKYKYIITVFKSSKVMEFNSLRVVDYFLKEVRYSVVSLIEKFLATASQQLDNFLETSSLLHDNNLAITLQKPTAKNYIT